MRMGHVEPDVHIRRSMAAALSLFTVAARWKVLVVCRAR